MDNLERPSNNNFNSSFSDGNIGQPMIPGVQAASADEKRQFSRITIWLRQHRVVLILYALDLLVLPLFFYFLQGIYTCYLIYCTSFHSMLAAVVVAILQAIFHLKSQRKLNGGLNAVINPFVIPKKFYFLVALILLATVSGYIYKVYFNIY